MLAGTFGEKFLAGLKISLRGLILFAVGGFMMGFETVVMSVHSIHLLPSFHSLAGSTS